MTPSIRILTASVEENKPFRAGSLVFQPGDAKKALQFVEALSGTARSWIENQPVMRVVFLGHANATPAPGARLKKTNANEV